MKTFHISSGFQEDDKKFVMNPLGTLKFCCAEGNLTMPRLSQQDKRKIMSSLVTKLENFNLAVKWMIKRFLPACYVVMSSS